MKNIVCALAGFLALGGAPDAALAQASCSSDGTPTPTAVFERFLSADCEACWTDRATPGPSADSSAIVLDWIVPGTQRNDAPLSAAATRDALERLQAVGRSAPMATDTHTRPVAEGAPQRRSALRVAHGLPFNDYLGTAIRWKPATAGTGRAALQSPVLVHYYLVLVEALPAGTEGSAVPRNMVRNVLHGRWNAQSRGAEGWMEARSMRIPEGADAARLKVVGWLEDSEGHVVAAAQSACR